MSENAQVVKKTRSDGREGAAGKTVARVVSRYEATTTGGRRRFLAVARERKDVCIRGDEGTNM